MKLPCTWKILIILWIQVGTVPGIHCKDVISHLSRQDVLLLKDEEDPKCFTRTESDFTCFFETPDNRTYDLLYNIENVPPSEKRCAMSVQRTDEGTFLHVCSFPDTDVFLHVETPLEVVERNTNISLYKRTVSVEDHILLDPPFNVSLHQNGQAGQLQVSWSRKENPSYGNIMHKIRYSSKSLGERTKTENRVLDDLKPGEEVKVQVTLKCALTSAAGHWSSWSQPVQAMVPQSADDVSLICYTSDLQNVICHWNESIYGAENEYRLFHKRCLSEASSCTEWTECLANERFTSLCRFHGDETRNFMVKLSSTSAPLSRTFYTQRFTLNNSIKTSPPGTLRSTLEEGKLCLNWEAPLLFPLAHLQYEVGYQTKGDGAWMMVSLEGPENGTCLEISTGTHYSVKVRAKPKGPIYSGHWSDWSDVLTGDTPTDPGMLLMLCIPLLMLISAIILIPLFSSYFSKLKQYFWPPVPNLDKVLQGFITEVNRQKWDPPVTAKQCPEDTTSSVVEIMSEDEVSRLGKSSEESTHLLSLEGSFSSREQVEESLGTEVFPDYVTLNRDTLIICTKGNKNMYKQIGEKVEPLVGDGLLEKCHCPCTDRTVHVPLGLGNEFLNHSYLPLSEAAERFNCKVTAARGPGNLYTNCPVAKCIE